MESNKQTVVPGNNPNEEYTQGQLSILNFLRWGAWTAIFMAKGLR